MCFLCVCEGVVLFTDDGGEGILGLGGGLGPGAFWLGEQFYLGPFFVKFLFFFS